MGDVIDREEFKDIVRNYIDELNFIVIYIEFMYGNVIGIDLMDMI